MKVNLGNTVKEHCYHCGEACNDNIFVESKVFCCEGCKLVYEIIQENNLCQYYDISKTPGISAKGVFNPDRFSFLEDENLEKKLVSFSDGDQTHITFYIPQIHCASCVWLLENLTKLNPAINYSRVNFLQKKLTVHFNSQKISLKEVANLLTYIGYDPHFNLKDVDKPESKKYNRKQIYKIGIAGFCFGNIMLLSLPEYFSFGSKMQEHGLSVFFNVLNLILSLPVFFYCASEFFVSAWNSIKQKYLNIDAPIALAILVTFIRSMYEILSGVGVGYLDSMTGIVFFMLLGRYFQNKTYDTLSFERDYKSYFPISVCLIQKNGDEKNVSIQDLKIGDRIIVKNNEIIPADAILFKGDANIDYSFVTGESALIPKYLGEIIYAGGKQIGSSLELEVVKNVSQSYLTELWNNDVFKEQRHNPKNFVNKFGQYITYGVLALALSSFIYWTFFDFSRAINAFSAVLIVACQCALLLSATFTNGNILRILGRNKSYFKNADVIENIANINTIVFDKTGTITQSQNSDIFYEGKTLSDFEKQLIRTLAVQSSHPLSKSILQWLPLSKKLEINNFEEHLGKGVSAQINGYKIRLGSNKYINGIDKINSSSVVYVEIEDALYGQFHIKNRYRDGLPELIKSLNSQYDFVVLSGDNDFEEKNLKSIFPSKAIYKFNQSPTEKLEFIKNLQKENKVVLMIGDGLNDAGALKQSNVGIAISENTNNFSPACDVIVEAEKFMFLKKIIDLCKNGKKIIIASFCISLLYNSVALSFAATGTLSPVIAAVLMPLSSISIVLFTTLASNYTAKKLGLYI